jgi:site-specific recombinase XerC
MLHSLDRALCLLMRRCGWWVSEVARLRLQDIDWAQQAVLDTSMTSNARYAKVSPQNVNQVYLKAILSIMQQNRV